ncbi:unnamed protein product [Lota lota]
MLRFHAVFFPATLGLSEGAHSEEHQGAPGCSCLRRRERAPPPGLQWKVAQAVEDGGGSSLAVRSASQNVVSSPDPHRGLSYSNSSDRPLNSPSSVGVDHEHVGACSVACGTWDGRATTSHRLP